MVDVIYWLWMSICISNPNALKSLDEIKSSDIFVTHHLVAPFQLNVHHVFAIGK